MTGSRHSIRIAGYIRGLTPELETRRLILRPLELADAEQAQVQFRKGSFGEVSYESDPLAESSGWEVYVM